ncbi:hypothetical protein C824_004537 [Schaedlerella arabinosiphila]|nr:hypothetical protein C824_004537 [Schaedlerella arabinosiphila]
MKPLFKMDIKNYAESDARIRRPSARAIIRTEDGRLAMVYSRNGQYYKFPGGGIRDGENPVEALAREVREETGLLIKKDSIREYGSVLRLQKSSAQQNTVFEQENFYYTCSAEETAGEQILDDYEKEAGFELRYVFAKDAAAENKKASGGRQMCMQASPSSRLPGKPRASSSGPHFSESRAYPLRNDFDLVMIARDTAVLEILGGTIPEPSVEMAEFLLRSAVQFNPGPWEQHSRNAAECAEKIAARCSGLDPERAYVYGLLHDIGRKFGITGLAHVYDGYRYLSEMGYANAARIALTHSFNMKDIHDYIGKFDVTESVQDEIQALLAGMEYNDYDCLIQLCDSLAKADGIVSVEERMNDVKSRHGYYPQKKWDMNLRLKEYFEEKMQEDVAEKLGVSRQTISKWETGETLPDIRQSKQMSLLYHVSLDELIEFDMDVKEIQDIIDRTSEETEEKIDWTKAWGKKYPILVRYQKEVNTPNYAVRLGAMVDELKEEYNYSDLDAFLVLKDILAKVWQSRKK